MTSAKSTRVYEPTFAVDYEIAVQRRANAERAQRVAAEALRKLRARQARKRRNHAEDARAYSRSKP
jgi:hypothetical protein